MRRGVARAPPRRREAQRKARVVVHAVARNHVAQRALGAPRALAIAGGGAGLPAQELLRGRIDAVECLDCGDRSDRAVLQERLRDEGVFTGRIQLAPADPPGAEEAAAWDEEDLQAAKAADIVTFASENGFTLLTATTRKPSFARRSCGSSCAVSA